MNIVVLDGKVLNPGDVDWSPISSLGNLTVYDDTAQDQITERVRGQDIVLVNKTLLGKDEIASLSHIGMLGVLATGYNNIDLPVFAEKNIPVCNVVAYGVRDVAEHAWALLLELCRATTIHSDSIKKGEWSTVNSWCYWKKTPRSLANLTLGIIGFGAIGQQVGKFGNAFGMRVCALRHSDRQKEPEYTPFAFVSLEELLETSHVISLHCPLTEETRHIIDAKAIERMRDGAIIINTARGPLLDEEACAMALKRGKLGGLGADVLACEPPKMNSSLLSAPNTIFTPHIAWATTSARQRLIDLTAENIRQWQKGTPCNVVNGVK